MSLAELWFFVIAGLWSTYLVLEGFDFGVGMMMGIAARNEDERSEMIETIAPVWDANEVWLLVVGGITFASFPAWYGTWLEGAYLGLVVLIIALLLRVISFEWRGRVNPRWRGLWSSINIAASVAAPLIWGLVLSVLLAGLPVAGSGRVGEMRYFGNILAFITPYSVLGALSLTALFAFHGALFLSLRLDGELGERIRERIVKLDARHLLPNLALPALLLVGGFLIATPFVAHSVNERSILPVAIPAALGLIALIAAVINAQRGKFARAFVCTILTVIGWVATLFIGLFPRIIVSTIALSDSVTIENAQSSHYTLVVMTVAAVVMIPVIILYQWWGFRTLMARLGHGKMPWSAPDGS